jgi:hypothetical protein
MHVGASTMQDDPTFKLGMALVILGTATDVSSGIPLIFTSTALKTCGADIPTGTG